MTYPCLMTPTQPTEVTVHVSEPYHMRDRYNRTSPYARRDYTVFHADGRRFIEVTSKDEVTRLVRKHFGKVAIVFVPEVAR